MGGMDSLQVEQMEQVATKKLKAVLESVPVAIDFVTEAAKAACLDERTLYQVQLAVDEACANVVHHAYEGMEAGDMEISYHLDGHSLSICVRDWGRGFAADEIADPNVDAPLAERTLGGLGVFLIKQVMDQFEYGRVSEGHNELVMVKRLRGAEQ